MLQSIGAIANVNEPQINSSIEMIKNFRYHNPDSSIVIFSDGNIKKVFDISQEYNCSTIIFKDRVGYPASFDINVSLEYLYRFLQCSLLIKENFYINLEPDCLVKNKLELENECQSVIVSPCVPMWMYYFYNNVERREKILPRILSYYKSFCKYDICGNKNLFDLLIGGGGYIYNKKFFLKILNDWDNFVKRTGDIKKIFDDHPPKILAFGEDLRWFFDYILSIQIQFYIDLNTDFKLDPNICGNSDISRNIIHPYKNFYI